ncbi:MAG: 4Fe-4S dicluster domain-containing protein [Chloroflexi bacterium]|nr:4Fe-4S dicluster domain-containing protein [Chloroflexota bacterium]
MNMKFLPAASLKDWLDLLRSHGTLIAPVKEKDGFIAFRPDPDFEDITLDYQNTVRPIREFFLPHSETLFNFETVQNGFDIERNKPEEPLVIFGVRLCDACGLEALDRAFSGKYTDPYYTERRKNALIISLFCTEPHPACFCEGVQKLMTGPKGADILLYPVEGGFLADPLSEKGDKIIGESKKLFKEPDAEQLKAKDAMVEKAVGAQSCIVDFSLLPEKFKELPPSSPFWREEGEGCVSCGVCSFLCPACQCFSVQDISDGKSGKRVRCWATCQDCRFAKMAGGIDPRPEKGERHYHRLSHKFADAPARNDMIFCTGCGRCIRYCPSHHDVLETLKKFLEYEEVKP